MKIGVLAKRGAERCMENSSPSAEYLTARIPGRSFMIVPISFDQIYTSVETEEGRFCPGQPPTMWSWKPPTE
nr:hypothetical protein [Desulfobacterales bacterium]